MSYLSDAPLRRHDLAANDKSALDPLKITCYHCQEKSARLQICELWGVSACPSCIETLHHSHHKSCKKAVPEPGSKAAKVRKVARTFTLTLTHYSGYHLLIRCSLGQQLRMEEHHLGTYLITESTMTLVLEGRDEINLAILEGLRSIHPD
jgi:hypothetical protein